LLGRGIERIAEEFGKSFANTAIHIATSDKEIVGGIPKKSIVLSTIGSAPNLEYSAVLFLEGLSLGSDMRSEERFLTTAFRYSAIAKGNVLIVERPEHPVVNALIKWSPTNLISKLLVELKEAQLPPYQRHILLKSEDSERVYSGLLASAREGRLPADTRILYLGDGVISIFFSLKGAKQVIDFIYQFQKKRSMSGKKLLKLRVDPYLLG
jgi:primosomal protein N'